VTPRAAVLVAIAVGGAVGALVRAGLGSAVPHDAWPIDTLIANLVGTVILAIVAALLAWSPAAPRWLHPLVAVGFCGSLTTFSGMQVEALVLMRDAAPGAAVAYLVASVALGLVAVIATRRAVQRVLR
jgi:CrcB protein